MFWVSASIVLYFLLTESVDALSFSFQKKITAPLTFDSTFLPPDTSSISEQACKDAASRMKRILVPVSEEISTSGNVGISYIHWPAKGAKKSSLPLVVSIIFSFYFLYFTSHKFLAVFS